MKTKWTKREWFASCVSCYIFILALALARLLFPDLIPFWYGFGFLLALCTVLVVSTLLCGELNNDKKSWPEHTEANRNSC